MKEETLMELGSLKLVETDYSDSVYVCGESNKSLAFELKVAMPAPYSDDCMEFDINKDDAKRLVSYLQDHFELDKD